MKKQTPLKPRGIRFSDEQWKFLEDKAKEENEKDPSAKFTTSDVARYAVDKLMSAGREEPS